MSIQAISYVLQYSRVQLWDRLVLISLANHANDRALSWPAVQTIAHEAGIGQRTVQRSLRRLEARGEIEPLGQFRVDRNGREYIERIENRKTVTYWLSGFEAWRREVGDPTAETPRQTYGNHTVSPRKREDRVQKTPLTPPDRRGNPAKGGTPTPPYMAPHPRQPDWDTPPYMAPHPAKADTDTPPRVAPDPSVNPSTAEIAPPTPPMGGHSNHRGERRPSRAQMEARVGQGPPSVPFTREWVLKRYGELWRTNRAAVPPIVRPIFEEEEKSVKNR